MFDLWTSDVHTSKPCLPTLKACVKFQYLLYPFSFTLAYYFGFEFSVHFQPLQFFSFNRYLSSVPSTILTILNPRESGMKSKVSVFKDYIFQRLLSLLPCFKCTKHISVAFSSTFLCVWSVSVWRVVCLGSGMREVVFLQQVNLLERKGASPRPPVPQQCWGKDKASGIPWRQWKYLHPHLTWEAAECS